MDKTQKGFEYSLAGFSVDDLLNLKMILYDSIKTNLTRIDLLKERYDAQENLRATEHYILLLQNSNSLSKDLLNVINDEFKERPTQCSDIYRDPSGNICITWTGSGTVS